jgi:hypothetical protein
MNKMSLLVITALLSTSVSSVNARWFWDKTKSEQEIKAEQAFQKAKGELKDIRTQAHEDQEVKDAKDKLKKAEIKLQEAKENANYAAKKARQSATTNVEKSKIELKDAKGKEKADKKVRKAQDKVAKAKAHLNKSINEANYAAEQVD